MRSKAIIREAWRNVTSGTARAVVLTLLLACVMATALAAELDTVASLEREAEEFRASGASILTITAPGRVDGARCDRLGDLPGVRAAGAITIEGGSSVSMVALPGAPLQMATVSAAFPRVIGATGDDGTGLLVPADVTAQLGWEVGDDLPTVAGTARLAGTYAYPNDGRREGYGYLAMEVLPGEDVFDECWVDSWPMVAGLNGLLHTTLRPGDGTGEAPQVRQLNPSKGIEFSGDRRYRERITRLTGIPVGVLALVVAFVSIRARRIELATALHDGMRRRDLWLIVLIEWGCWALPAALMVAAAGIAAFERHGGPAVGAALGARVTTLGAAGSLVGVAAALLTTRERDLFSYSKDR